MRLTRRDAMAAIGAAGIAVGAGTAWTASSNDTQESDIPITSDELETLVAAAEILYPSEVEQIGSFVERYIGTVATERPEHARGIADAVAYLEDFTAAWYDTGYSDLESPTRNEVLRRMNLGSAEPDPTGSDVDRVRYYLVNELLFALYSTPTGGALVGLENPQGYPGGLQSYQRGPDR